MASLIRVRLLSAASVMACGSSPRLTQPLMISSAWIGCSSSYLACSSSHHRPRGRWWLEEHAKYDDEHPIHALEIIKGCVKRGEEPQAMTDAALKSLTLMREA